MLTIRVVTHIQAPAERCFDLARSIDLHIHSAAHTVGGVTSGLIGPGEEVTWEATHFGIRQRLTSRITVYEPPHHFQDSAVQGTFRTFDHDHWFEAEPAGGTRMTDVLRFAAPFGPVGWAVERLILGPYLKRFLRQRGEVVRQAAESKTCG